MKTTVFVLWAAITATVCSADADKDLGIWCIINGKAVHFTEDPNPAFSSGGGMALIPHVGREWLFVDLP